MQEPKNLKVFAKKVVFFSIGECTTTGSPSIMVDPWLPFSQFLRMLIMEKEERLREQLLMHGAR